MENKVILILIAIILIPCSYANALTGDVELTLENIQIDPLNPKIGEHVTITGEAYNAGNTNTGSVASIITMAFFVDEELVGIKDIGDVKMGIQNKIEIASESIWKFGAGEHTIKVVIDYHNTLDNRLDSPDNNIMEKTFMINPLNSTKILLTTHPEYGIQGKESTVNSTALLIDSNSNNSLINKKIIFNLDGEETELITDKKGRVSFQYINNFFNNQDVKVFFEGDNQHQSSRSSSTLYSLPENMTSAMVIKIQDEKKQYNFVEHIFEIIIFQDSYQNIVKQIKPDSTMLLDSETLFVKLPPEHDYFTEVYLNGEFFSVTDKESLEKDRLIIQEIKIPESVFIKFRVISSEDLPINAGIVKSGVHSVDIENGFTDWIDIIPITQKLHLTEIILPNQSSVKSESFTTFPGERKIITLKMKEFVESEIPNWIKNNAGWWAEDTIDDETFIQGIEFMIKEGIIKITATSQDRSLNSDEIPNWIKNNAGWWAEDTIDDETFIQGIEFMIKEGIIKS